MEKTETIKGAIMSDKNCSDPDGCSVTKSLNNACNEIDELKAEIEWLKKIPSNSDKQIAEVRAENLGLIDALCKESDQRDTLRTALDGCKANSFPGLAVSEGTLLNRIYRIAGKALKGGG